MLSEIELKMDAELARVVAYIKDELKDAIIAGGMQEIIYDRDRAYPLEDDEKYYRILVGAAEIIKAHYEP